MWNVEIKKKVHKNTEKLPENIRALFAELVSDLVHEGPVQTAWQNYSMLGKEKYHCHLTRRYVACWTNKNGTIEIEVYYVGSRENAPY